MRKLIFCVSVALFLVGNARCQIWTDSIVSDIRINLNNPAAVTPTTFRLWIPDSSPFVKAVLLVSARGVGFNNGADGSGIYGRNHAFRFALNPIIRNMAAETNTAILCFQAPGDAGLVTNFNPQLGHADSLLAAVSKLAIRTNHPELNFIPFLAFGHSLGSVFSQNIALWNPGKVAATIMYQTGGFVDQPGWTSNLNPAMNLQKVPTLMTSGECEGPDINNNADGFYAQATFNRVKAERMALRPMHQIIRRNGSHSILMPMEAEMIALFLRKAIVYRIPPTTEPAVSPVLLNEINTNGG